MHVKMAEYAHKCGGDDTKITDHQLESSPFFGSRSDQFNRYFHQIIWIPNAFTYNIFKVYFLISISVCQVSRHLRTRTLRPDIWGPISLNLNKFLWVGQTWFSIFSHLLKSTLFFRIYFFSYLGILSRFWVLKCPFVKFCSRKNWNATTFLTDSSLILGKTWQRPMNNDTSDGPILLMRMDWHI